MNELKIEYIKVGDLTPYEKNARHHADADLETIIASIEKFGFDDPIGIWSEKNIIVEGHGRLIAAKRLGMKEVPCIRLDHLTDEDRRAYAIIHNKTAELSKWDFEKLDAEIKAIELDDFPPFDDLDKKIKEVAPETEENVKMLHLQLCETQYQIVMRVIDYITKNIPMDHTFGNKNKKSNAIFEGAYLWMENEGLI